MKEEEEERAAEVREERPGEEGSSQDPLPGECLLWNESLVTGYLSFSVSVSSCSFLRNCRENIFRGK